MNVANMEPINKTAALVTSKGTHYVPNKKIRQLHWTAAPGLKPIPNDVKNIIGIRIGRFTVYGYFGKGKWVVRCDCGHFETRNRKAIFNERNKCDRCEFCRQKAYLRRNEAYRLNGFNSSDQWAK